MNWIAGLAQRTLTLEYQCGGVTKVPPGHTTGWRTLPGTLTATLAGHETVLQRPGLPDLRVRSGETVFVPQGQHHCLIVTSKCSGVSRWSHISYRLLGGIDVFSLIETPTTLSGRTSAAIGRLNEALAGLRRKEDCQLHTVARRQSLSLELLALLAERSTVRAGTLPMGESLQRLGAVLELISGNIADPPDIEQLARACSLSVSRFHSTFKSVMGISPGRYLQDLRLLRAKHLLLSSNVPVKTVAAETGFGDVFHFSRLFRKRCGASPSGYRQQARSSIM